MATATLAFGSRLYADLAGGSTYAEIADIKEVSAPGDPDAPDVDVTALYESVALRTFKRGLKTQGEFSFKQFWTKTRYTSLETPFAAGTAVAWRLNLSDNATPASASRWAFTGYIKKLTIDPQSDPDQPVVISCVVKVNSAITYTEGS